MKTSCILAALVLFVSTSGLSASQTKLTLTGDWSIRVETGGKTAELNVAPPETIAVKAERHDRLPVFNEKGPAYARGAKPLKARAQECPTALAVDPDSIVVREKAEADSTAYEVGKDYKIEALWGCVGRLEGGRIGENQPVFLDYVYGTMRIDSVVRARDGRILLKPGTPHVTIPAPPTLADGETRLANIWIRARIDRLSDDLLFPILETEYPEPPKASPSVAERLIPKTMAKLRAGETVQILAWGDSVTDANYLPDKDVNRWQEQFVRRLREKYPKANIVLTTEAWGGRNSDSYRREPPGSPKNYKEKVLDRKPDLIVSEFVNDSGLRGEVLESRYSTILNEFKEIGAEWIILTPHYVRADWMGLKNERDIDEDPRPYTQSVRAFAEKHHVALADGAKRYGRLWRQGIPYSTLMMNNINHPDPAGMKLFADALMELFP